MTDCSGVPGYHQECESWSPSRGQLDDHRVGRYDGNEATVMDDSSNADCQQKPTVVFAFKQMADIDCPGKFPCS
ncbi:hypothetical protein J6590_031359 [Homalodisca vitripennis]|nr:hypothetical protein J6590_031359 [Homalodisca vitripennis]